jgi:hypothetical protein
MECGIVCQGVLSLKPPGHLFPESDYPYDMADTNPIGSVKAAVQDEKLQVLVFRKNLTAVLALLSYRPFRSMIPYKMA